MTRLPLKLQSGSGPLPPQGNVALQLVLLRRQESRRAERFLTCPSGSVWAPASAGVRCTPVRVWAPASAGEQGRRWMLKQVQHDGKEGRGGRRMSSFEF